MTTDSFPVGGFLYLSIAYEDFGVAAVICVCSWARLLRPIDLLSILFPKCSIGSGAFSFSIAEPKRFRPLAQPVWVRALKGRLHDSLENPHPILLSQIYR